MNKGLSFPRAARLYRSRDPKDRELALEHYGFDELSSNALWHYTKMEDILEALNDDELAEYNYAKEHFTPHMFDIFRLNLVTTVLNRADADRNYDKELAYPQIILSRVGVDGTYGIPATGGGYSYYCVMSILWDDVEYAAGINVGPNTTCFRLPSDGMVVAPATSILLCRDRITAEHLAKYFAEDIIDVSMKLVASLTGKKYECLTKNK